MLYERIKAYRASLITFVASVVLGGLAIAFITTPMVSLATASQVSIFGILLLTIGLALLVASGYLYVKSQNIPLEVSVSWETKIKLRIDGGVDSDMPKSFKNSNYIAVFAYASLLQSEPNLQPIDIFGFSPDFFPLPESSISFTGPPGDRMGANKIDKFASELIEYLLMYWLSWLQHDVVTQRGKVIPRIEFYRDIETKAYSYEDLKIANNRFLRTKTLIEPVVLPKDIELVVEKESDVFPKIILRNEHIKIVLTYSTPKVGLSKEYFFTVIRIYFSAIPTRSMWKLDFTNLLSRDNRFHSDIYYRSVKAILENLQIFLPII